MPFLAPNQQCQSTEGTLLLLCFKIVGTLLTHSGQCYYFLHHPLLFICSDITYSCSWRKTSWKADSFHRWRMPLFWPVMQHSVSTRKTWNSICACGIIGLISLYLDSSLLRLRTIQYISMHSKNRLLASLDFCCANQEKKNQWKTEK